jgi:hypothetical protein
MNEVLVYLVKWELLFLVIVGLIAWKEGRHGLSDADAVEKHPRLGR